MKNLKILSLGLGQQSTALYFMSCFGLVERFDYAIFADPGAEKPETYFYLKWLLKWQEENKGIPILWVGKKSILHDLQNGRNTTGQSFASIPLFTKDENGTVGMLRRQCTDEYKIQEVNKAIRKLYGLKARKRLPETYLYMGITMEEIERMKTPQNNQLTFVYSFLGYSTHKSKGVIRLESPLSYSRSSCLNFYNEYKLPIPPKSACFFCPFQNEDQWLYMMVNEPELFKEAVDLDYSLRDSTKRGVKQPAYLHRSCVPLDKVQFQHLAQYQIDFKSECSGYCGV